MLVVHGAWSFISEQDLRNIDKSILANCLELALSVACHIWGNRRIWEISSWDLVENKLVSSLCEVNSIPAYSSRRAVARRIHNYFGAVHKTWCSTYGIKAEVVLVNATIPAASYQWKLKSCITTLFRKEKGRNILKYGRLYYVNTWSYKQEKKKQIKIFNAVLCLCALLRYRMLCDLLTYHIFRVP